MKQYLRLISDPSKFTDSADYPGDVPPFPAPAGMEWAKGEPPIGSAPFKPLTLNEKLDGLFMSQPPEIRAQYYTFKAAVKLAIDSGDVLAAKKIIEGVSVPPELASLKVKMLSEFS